MKNWDIERSADLYGIDAWGEGYFGINARGHLTVRPEKSRSRELDLHELVQSLRKRGIHLPLLIRFDGIIRDRVHQIQTAFAAAIDEASYEGHYRLAYPIKVNQQRHVVDSIRAAGGDAGIGLEVGSKPELLAVLAIHNTRDGLLLCNGYKDAPYIELALLARKLGRRSILIVEQLHEIRTILRIADELGIDPEIGVRFKPARRGSGRWEASGGEEAKFGLRSYEIVEAIETLRSHDRLHWLKLLHFHIGSQIPSIGSIKTVLKEAARMYAELSKLAPSLGFFDVGGGLGVDYNGSRTSFDSSMNYTLEEYARDVVYAIYEVCEASDVPHPDLISESGRAAVAHHSVLITEVMDVTPVTGGRSDVEEPAASHEIIEELRELTRELNAANCHETLHDAIGLKEEILDRFTQGDLNLIQRGYADRLLKGLMARINAVAQELDYIPEDLEKLDERLRDTYFSNFSLFQSLPDSWAIHHVFPVLPIHRLDVEPTRRAVVADLTCDSDGVIDRFIDLKGVKRYVKLHELRDRSPYYLGIFLVGAYQEILGDLHNLFGDTNAVHMDYTAANEVEIRAIVEGDSVRDVLHYVQFEAKDLLERLHHSVERSLRDGDLTAEESAKLCKRFREELEGYTYLLSRNGE